MIQLFLIDARLYFNSGERAYTCNQRWEAVLLTEEETIDEKKKKRAGLIEHDHYTRECKF